jgi:hypothetical protein
MVTRVSMGMKLFSGDNNPEMTAAEMKGIKADVASIEE